MFKVAVSFMALSTLHRRFIAELYRMLKHAVLINDRLTLKGLIDGHVTYSAIIPDNLSISAKVLSIMTSKTALRIVMTDIVRVRLPIGFHLGEEIGLIDPL